MPLTKSRYDGLADWYESFRPNAARNAADAADLLGPGEGLCLDLGCGTGHYFSRRHALLLRRSPLLQRAAQRVEAGRRVLAHPTYRIAGWHEESPWWGYNIRGRFGMRHRPLAELLNSFADSGITIEHVAEPGERAVPVSLAFRARNPAPGDHLLTRGELPSRPAAVAEVPQPDQAACLGTRLVERDGRRGQGGPGPAGLADARQRRT